MNPNNIIRKTFKIISEFLFPAKICRHFQLHPFFTSINHFNENNLVILEIKVAFKFS